MRKIQRARRTVDISKLSSAVSRPGIDPRCWVTLAQVTDVGFDAAEGFFVDVEFLPTGEQQCCLLGSHYAGENYGQAALPQVDDVVVVVVPNGDQSAGPVVICKLWNAADPPPADGSSGTDPTDDYLLRIRAGRNYTLRASGAGGVSVITEGEGDVVIAADGSGKVKLGTSALQPAVLGNTLYAWMETVAQRLLTLEANALSHTHTSAAPGFPTGTPDNPAAPPPVAPPDPRATDTEVK